ncbi:MAG: NFYB/HAP3 family transcription factor subunit [Candidatus Aenigmatarchaeota archaeon]
MKTKEFPYTPIGRIAKKSGVKRISDSALKAIREIILEEAEEKAREIVKIAEHSGRKTVLRRDVQFVIGKRKES